MMIGKIFVKDLVLRCNIGTTKEERANKQDILVNILLFVDFSKAAITDDLKYTVDYTEPYNKIGSCLDNSYQTVKIDCNDLTKTITKTF